MARVTVEDCLDYVENRFELVLVASKRARQLVKGRSESLVPWGNHKAPVVALKEIAAGKINKIRIEDIESNKHAEVKQPSLDTEEGQPVG